MRNVLRIGAVITVVVSLSSVLVAGDGSQARQPSGASKPAAYGASAGKAQSGHASFRPHSRGPGGVVADGPFGYQAYGGPYQDYGFDSYPGTYGRSPYFYFYDLYSREAAESRRAADDYEASLAREGKLTGPAEVGAFPTDFLPRSSRNVVLTLDGQPISPSPSGLPLVIESGQHSLRIAANNAPSR